MERSVECHEDFLVSLLRLQVSSLAGVLQSLEEGGRPDGAILEKMKRVEKELKWLRKLYSQN